MVETKRLKFNEINWKATKNISPRHNLNRETIEEYAEILDNLPLMAVFEVPEIGYVLTRGQHRIEAHKLKGLDEANFCVYRGSIDDASWDADSDNLKNSIRYSRLELRDIIKRYLQRHSDRSNVWVAKDCSTTDKTVKTVRIELETTGQIEAHELLQDRLGVWRPGSLDRTLEPELEPKPNYQSPEIPKDIDNYTYNNPSNLLETPEDTDISIATETPKNPRLEENPYKPYRVKRSLEERKLPCWICSWPITQTAHLLEFSIWGDNLPKMDLCARCHETYDIIIKAMENQPGNSQELYGHLKRKLGNDPALEELIRRAGEAVHHRKWRQDMYREWVEHYDQHATK